MFVLRIEPVSSLVAFVFVALESCIFVDAECDIRLVNDSTERSIETLDVLELISEGKLGNETARPSIFFDSIRARSKDSWEVSPNVPLLSVGQHVKIRRHWATLPNLDLIFVVTSKLPIRVLLEATMVLIEVVEAIVDLRVREVNIGGKTHKARQTSSTHTRALFIIA